MKNNVTTVWYCLLLLCLCVSCGYSGDNGNISLTLSESGNYYKVMAAYPRRNTIEVERYMDQQLGKASNISFIHTRIDADITLDDGTKFYMNNSHGNLELKFDKSKNSYAAYKKIKAFAEGLKPVLQQ